MRDGACSLLRYVRSVRAPKCLFVSISVCVSVCMSSLQFRSCVAWDQAGKPKCRHSKARRHRYDRNKLFIEKSVERECGCWEAQAGSLGNCGWGLAWKRSRADETRWARNQEPGTRVSESETENNMSSGEQTRRRKCWIAKTGKYFGSKHNKLTGSLVYILTAWKWQSWVFSTHTITHTGREPPGQQHQARKTVKWM